MSAGRAEAVKLEAAQLRVFVSSGWSCEALKLRSVASSCLSLSLSLWLSVAGWLADSAGRLLGWLADSAGRLLGWLADSAGHLLGWLADSAAAVAPWLAD